MPPPAWAHSRARADWLLPCTPLHTLGATYICKPTSVTVGSVVVHSVPYTRGRLREPIPPCDVLATHSPPKGVLDLCYSGGHGGCRFLRSAVAAHRA